MGSVVSRFSRRDFNVETAEYNVDNPYRWPPRDLYSNVRMPNHISLQKSKFLTCFTGPRVGKYFDVYFMLGGEHFESPQPESFLFGDNEDLNCLGSKPVVLPFPVPNPGEPIRMLQSQINIRHDSLHLVKIDREASQTSRSPSEEPETPIPPSYNLEFTFDSEVRCSITLFYMASEDFTDGMLTYRSRDPSMDSDSLSFKQGTNQIYSNSAHVIHPETFSQSEWQFRGMKKEIPIVIFCLSEVDFGPVERGQIQPTRQAHVTFASLERQTDGGYVVKTQKQKQVINGIAYLLHEIYGIENKTLEPNRPLEDDEIEDFGTDCIVCMTDPRDTIILPCRHLCLCSQCADSLRYQANNCPICRMPFRALLQIRALQPKTKSVSDEGSDPAETEDVPAGFTAVPLIEALNGPDARDENTVSLPPVRPVGQLVWKNRLERIKHQFLVEQNATTDSDSETRSVGAVEGAKSSCHPSDDPTQLDAIRGHSITYLRNEALTPIMNFNRSHSSKGPRPFSSGEAEPLVSAGLNRHSAPESLARTRLSLPGQIEHNQEL